MVTVLGIDAAWTAHHPSGVALVRRRGRSWRVVASAASEAEFLALAGDEEPVHGAFPVERVAAASARLAGEAPAVVAVDMPLSLDPIVGRRGGDNEVNRRFGAAGCATHSASAERPGKRADELRADWAERGVELATTASDEQPALLEVYPHVSLLALCGAEKRLPYKVSRSLRYWPGTTTRERIAKLLRVWCRIADALAVELGELDFTIPKTSEVATLASLKAVEDRLDALVCAWQGARFAEGDAEALGDERSAIWVPRTGGRAG